MVENKRCILVADDEPRMVRALHDFFRVSGFCVLEAKDGMLFYAYVVYSFIRREE